MKNPTITELASLVKRDRKTLYYMRDNNPALYKMLWRGYLYYLTEKELESGDSL